MKNRNEKIRSVAKAQASLLPNSETSTYEGRKDFFQPFYETLEAKAGELEKGDQTVLDRMDSLARAAELAISNKKALSEEAGYPIKQEIRRAYGQAQESGQTEPSKDDYLAFEAEIHGILEKNGVSTKVKTETRTTLKGTDAASASAKKMMESLTGEDNEKASVFLETSTVVEGSNLEAARGQIEINDYVTCNYQKRILSFIHGAYIALDVQGKSEPARKDAEQKLMNIYQGYLNKNELNNKDFSDFTDELVLFSMQEKIPWKDIVRGEFYANVEHGRKAVSGEVHGTTVTETPVNIQALSTFKKALAPLQAYLEGKEKTPPDWFSDLNRVEQHWWRENLNAVLNNTITFDSVPSTMRNLPIPANFVEHSCVTEKTNDYNIRVGIIAAYQVKGEAAKKKATEAIASVVAETAVEKAKERQQATWGSAILQSMPPPLVAYITLLTPHEEMHQKYGLGTATEARENPYAKKYQFESHHVLKVADDNRAMVIMGQAGLAASINKTNTHLLQMNFSLNMARAPEDTFGDPYNRNRFQSIKDTFAAYTSAIQNAENAGIPLLGEAGIFKDEKAKNGYERATKALAQLNDLFVRYQDKEMAAINLSVHKRTNPELYAACYTSFIIQGLGGVPLDGCKSAKDRTGMLHIYQDAMSIYYSRHGRLPHPQDIDEDPEAYTEFMDLTADIYLTKLAQEIGSQNSYGASGIKEGSDLGADWATIAEAKFGKTWDEATKFQAQGFIDAVNRKKPGLLKAETKLAETNKISESNFQKAQRWAEKQIEKATKGIQGLLAMASERFSKKQVTKLDDKPESGLRSNAALKETEGDELEETERDELEETEIGGEPVPSLTIGSGSGHGKGPRVENKDKKREAVETRAGTPLAEPTEVTTEMANSWAQKHAAGHDYAWLQDEAKVEIAANKQSVRVDLKKDNITHEHKYDIALIAIASYLQAQGEGQEAPLLLKGADDGLVESAVKVCKEYGIPFEVAAGQPNRDTLLRNASTIETKHKIGELVDFSADEKSNLKLT